MAKKELHVKEKDVTELIMYKTPEEIVQSFSSILEEDNTNGYHSLVGVRCIYDDGVEVYLDTYRFETDEEEAYRLEREANQLKVKEYAERLEYLRLKAKFGD